MSTTNTRTPAKPSRALRLLALYALGLAAACSATSDQIAITGVTVVDVATGTLRPDQTVILAGDTIAAVGPADETRPTRGSRRVDGTGRFLIPGLWDMHVHLSMTGSGALPALLANGVTGVRDMGGDPVVLQWRDSVAAGALEGPRIKAAGIIVESARWLKAVIELTEPLNRPDLMADLERRFGIETVEDAENAIDSLVRLGADFVKIRNYPSPETYGALVRAAKRHGLPLAGHAPGVYRVPVVSDSGFGSFEHGVLASDSGALHEAFGRMTPEVRRELFVRFARNNTAFDPTFVSGAARLVPDSAIVRMIADSAGASDPRLQYVPHELREAWRTQLAMRSVDPDPNTDWGEIHRSGLRAIREMVDAGISIVTGTDLPVVSLVPGFSLLDELETLVDEAGLTPAEALLAGTANSAAVAGLAGRSGTIAVGQLADLVLLEANPLSDIRATRQIAAVVANGKLYDRAALDQLLTEVR